MAAGVRTSTSMRSSLLEAVAAVVLLVAGVGIQQTSWSGEGAARLPPDHGPAPAGDSRAALGALEYRALLGSVARPEDVAAVAADPELAEVLADLQAWMPMEIDRPWHYFGGTTPGVVFFGRPVMLAGDTGAGRVEGARVVSADSPRPHDRLIVAWITWMRERRMWGSVSPAPVALEALLTVDDHSRLCLEALDHYLEIAGVPPADRLLLLQRRARTRQGIGLVEQLLPWVEASLAEGELEAVRERSDGSVQALAGQAGSWGGTVRKLERLRMLGDELRFTWSLLGLVWLACAVALGRSRRRERDAGVRVLDDEAGGAGARRSWTAVLAIALVMLLATWLAMLSMTSAQGGGGGAPATWVLAGRGSLQALALHGVHALPLALIVAVLLGIGLTPRDVARDSLGFGWTLLIAAVCAGGAQLAVLPAHAIPDTRARWLLVGVLGAIVVLVAAAWGRPGGRRRRGLNLAWILFLAPASLAVGAARAGKLPPLADALAEEAARLGILIVAGVLVWGIHGLASRGRAHLDPLRLAALLTLPYLVAAALVAVPPGVLTPAVEAIPAVLTLGAVAATAGAFSRDRQRTQLLLPSSPDLAAITLILSHALVILATLQLTTSLLTHTTATHLLTQSGQ